jgi:hypothetical protein
MFELLDFQCDIAEPTRRQGFRCHHKTTFYILVGLCLLDGDYLKNTVSGHSNASKYKLFPECKLLLSVVKVMFPRIQSVCVRLNIKDE